VVGLGNPGKEYEGTRHNIGFAVLDRLADKFGCSFRSKWRFSAKIAEAMAGDAGKVVLAKPQTYMNRSGTAVNTLLQWLKVAPAQLLVVVDDADLPLGQIRLRVAGGSGGHNGLRSIIETLGGDEEFARLRVGIGRSAPLGADICPAGT
jgi:PTH1 family peptidyl-tRNA hydrolase